MEVNRKNPGALYPTAHQASWTWLMAVGDLVFQLIEKGYIHRSIMFFMASSMPGNQTFSLKSAFVLDSPW